MKVVKIGRGPGNDCVINDNVVSSRHAIITVSDFGEVTIEDQNSTNGTYVDGRRVTKAKLSPNSVVVLGNHSIDWKQIIQSGGNRPPKPKTQAAIPSNVVEKKLIGRNAMAQIRYSFDDVSDHHAYLCRTDTGNVMIVDNNSTNGTYVNGQRITGVCALNKGDNVSISNRHPLQWEAVYKPKSATPLTAILSVAVCVAVVALIVLFKPWNQGSKDWNEVYAQHKHDVVYIEVQSAFVTTYQGQLLSKYIGVEDLDFISLGKGGAPEKGISGSTGTGFFYSKDGKMLTNRHVVSYNGDQKADELKVKQFVQATLKKTPLAQLAPGIQVNYRTLSVSIAQNDTYVNSSSELLPCTVLKVSDNEELDVAVLQTNSKSLPTGATLVDLTKASTSAELKIGDGICTIGFPMGSTIGSTSVGLEANNQSGEKTQERGSYQYGHNITVHHGASGSPVYDRKGRFAGIIVSGFLNLSQGYNHAIQPSPVIDFVRGVY